MTDEQTLRHLRRAHQVACAAVERGRHPFGAVLVAADGETVLLEQGNVDVVNHAESTLARIAAHRFDAATLWDCTLVSTCEPCAMCAATQYWAHIGRLVYGISETQLRDITGDDPANPTLDLPCRDVFAAGRKAIQVVGPVAAVHDEIAALHRGFWRP